MRQLNNGLKVLERMFRSKKAQVQVLAAVGRAFGAAGRAVGSAFSKAGSAAVKGVGKLFSRVGSAAAKGVKKGTGTAGGGATSAAAGAGGAAAGGGEAAVVSRADVGVGRAEAPSGGGPAEGTPFKPTPFPRGPLETGEGTGRPSPQAPKPGEGMPEEPEAPPEPSEGERGGEEEGEGEGEEGKEGEKKEGKPGKKEEEKPPEKEKPGKPEPIAPEKYGPEQKALEKEQTKPPYLVMGMIAFGILNGVLVMKTGETESPMLKMGAIAPIILLIVAALIITKEYRKKNYGLVFLLGCLLLVGGVYGFLTRTMPYASEAIQSGEIMHIGSRTVGGGQGGIRTIVQDAYSSYQRNMQIATGQAIEGDVEKTQREDVGLDILPPYLPNPKKINQNEIDTLEIAARIKGFDPKTEMTATVVCSMQSRKEAQSWKKTFTAIGELERFPGEQQEVSPVTVKGVDFDKEVTCYPRPSTCGDYVVTLTAEADHLRTDAHMENYIMDKTVFIEKLKSYAEARKTVLRSDAEVTAAAREMYPEVGEYKSVSEKGAVKVVMATQKAPLIPVGGEGEDESDLTLRVALENAMNGWIISVNEVEVTIPQYFTVKQGYCRGWTVEGNKISLSQSYLRNASLEKVTKGLQKVFPSCHLVPRNTQELTEPRQATFLAKVDYNYIVQQKSDIQIMTETGELCKEEGRTTAQAGTTTTQQGEGATNQDITACQGKSEGDACAEKQTCLTADGQLKCVPECRYNAAKGLQGLTSSHDCVTPQSSCAAGTVRAFSCKSITTTEEGACCVRRT